MWVLDQLGRYIVQDGEAGEAVYRVAHQSLADHLRPPYQARHDQVFDPQALPVARFAGSQVPGAAGTAGSPPWCRRTCGGTCGGTRLTRARQGLAILRQLAAARSRSAARCGAGGLQVADSLQYWGHRQEAVAPAEEAVQLLPGAGRRQPRLPPRPRRGAEQPRQPLQRGRAAAGRPRPGRGSRPAIPGAGRRPTPPTSPTSPWR